MQTKFLYSGIFIRKKGGIIQNRKRVPSGREFLQ
jgi:hypothetical protein